MLIRRFSILCITVFCLSVIAAVALFHAKTPVYAKPLLDRLDTQIEK